MVGIFGVIEYRETASRKVSQHDGNRRLVVIFMAGTENGLTNTTHPVFNSGVAFQMTQNITEITRQGVGDLYETEIGGIGLPDLRQAVIERGLPVDLVTVCEFEFLHGMEFC